ncbi:MAG: hypothetical protein LBR41_01505 [Rickettsiales bacterium]|nr:hypothetical protein [Rickettsiales bacterium]
MKKIILTLTLILTLTPAFAEWGIVDSLSLAPFIPLVLQSMLTVASAGYDFFVGNGNGIIFILIWAWLAFFIVMYLVKMFLPNGVVEFFDGKKDKELPDALKISENVLKPIVRGLIAAAILLPIKPTYITDLIVDPFMQIGAAYSNAIMPTGESTREIPCPEFNGTMSVSVKSCAFMTGPVQRLTDVNNQMIKRGLNMVTGSVQTLMLLIPSPDAILSMFAGILLVSTFVSNNFFMALLIINAIFELGMSLILYPFRVLTFVAKPKKPDAWIDPWSAFGGIADALRKLIITMISCSFILVINIALVRAILGMGDAAYSDVAAGVSVTNLGLSDDGGGTLMIAISSVLTFYLMTRIFAITREWLDKFAGKGADALYKSTTAFAKTATGRVAQGGKSLKKILKKVEDKKNKKG